jgi:DNA-binding IclR family transcriptional regulator
MSTLPAETNASTEAKGGIQVIDRMMRILDELSVSAEPLSLKQLAHQAELHPSTAHRILAAMLTSGFVERVGAGNYRLGIRLLSLGNLVKSRLNVREEALPFMQQLHRDLGESVNLGIRQENEIVYVERTSSGQASIRVVHLVGARAPLHVTSAGKLFLSADNRDKVAKYAKETGLPGFTASSLTTLPALEKELEQVRKLGYAHDNEEIEVGLRCIAAPVRDESGAIVAGLSVSAPVDRYRASWPKSVSEAALAISLAIGYVPPGKLK